MNSTLVRIDVAGLPAPQGSKNPVPVKTHGKWATGKGGRPIISLIDSCKRLKPWREMVARRARAEWGGRRLELGPIILVMTFVFERPRNHFRTGKFSAELRPDAPQHLLSFPDVDKLARAICDSLTGVIYSDDAQVIQIDAAKKYGQASGARIQVEAPLRDEDDGAVDFPLFP